MSVPKCKDCEYLIKNKSDFWSNLYSHYCTNFPHVDEKGNIYFVNAESKYIYAKDLKTSPKWCKKR